MRSRSEHRARIWLAAAVLTASSAALAPSACAQGSPGAERYEVTIVPPRREGTEVQPPTQDSAIGSSSPSPAVRGEPAPGDANATLGAAPPKAVATTTPPSNQPMKTMQVGAFREYDRADSLRETLAASFQDVIIVTVQSGGEPLYRVNVGRFPHGPELDAVRRRLVSAGFPAFEVAASKPATAN